MSQLEQMAAQTFLNTHGMSGGKAITGTAKVEPATGYYFCAILATAATVVASQENVAGSNNPTLGPIPVGATVYGKFASITLTSGTAIGYYAKL
jgi:K+ transporter